jgi:RNA polymerase sigma factor (sigma-70 family)
MRRRSASISTPHPNNRAPSGERYSSRSGFGQRFVSIHSLFRQQAVSAFRHGVPMTTMAPTDDQTLRAALCRGDERALTDVHVQYRDLVFEVVRRVVVDHRAAEDVTQEVFVYLWRNAERIDLSRGSIRAYLVTVARRRAIDHVRSEESRRRRENRVSSGPGSGKNEVCTPDFADDVATSDLRARNSAAVQVALKSLPEAERVVIDLVYFHGYTLCGAAAATNAPEGTAKTRVRRALRRLGENVVAQVAEAF